MASLGRRVAQLAPDHIHIGANSEDILDGLRHIVLNAPKHGSQVEASLEGQLVQERITDSMELAIDSTQTGYIPCRFQLVGDSHPDLGRQFRSPSR